MLIVLAILALGLLIVVHEGGHFVVARWFKMRVERFSIGFGPAILKWTTRGKVRLEKAEAEGTPGTVEGDRGTQFQIAPIPFGGFVQITGMNPHEDFDPKDPHVYPNRPTWQRFATIFAGPFTNILLSIVLIFIVFVGAGMSTVFYTVGKAPEGKAEGKSVTAGLLHAGDRILAIDGRPVYASSATALQERVQQTGAKGLDVTVLRDGKEVTVRIVPERDEKGLYRLGMWIGDPYIERRPVGVGTAAAEAVKYPWIKSGEMLGNLWDVVRRKQPPNATGPVGITYMIKRSFELGWVTALEFLAFLNVALGLFNLLPVPALDGGRLVFLGYEIVTRRRPNPRIEAAVHMVGLVVLMVLIVMITWKDIHGLVS